MDTADAQLQRDRLIEQPPEGPPVPEANGPSDGASIMDGLRALRERKAQESDRYFDLDVPGYEARLAVIYRYPEGGYKRAVKAVERELESKAPDARLEGACDLLVASCASVVGRNTEGALVDLLTERVLVQNELPEKPLRFDKALAEALQIEIPSEVKGTGRHVVRQLFSPRGAAQGIYDGDLALITTSNRVFAWLNGVERELDEDALGE